MPKDQFYLQKQSRVHKIDEPNGWWIMKQSTDVMSLAAYLCVMLNNKDVVQDEHRFRILQVIEINGKKIPRVLQITD